MLRFLGFWSRALFLEVGVGVGEMPLFFYFNTQTMRMTLYPGGIQTRVSYSWGWRDCTTPPDGSFKRGLGRKFVPNSFTYSIYFSRRHEKPGLPDGVCFQTKNANLGKLWRALEWIKLVLFYGCLEYITDIWYILWPFGNLVAVCYILHRFGISNKEKSGNPGVHVTNAARIC
jgi:hypothetical protein